MRKNIPTPPPPCVALPAARAYAGLSKGGQALSFQATQKVSRSKMCCTGRRIPPPSFPSLRRAFQLRRQATRQPQHLHLDGFRKRRAIRATLG
jgi:hypothetical protein